MSENERRSTAYILLEQVGDSWVVAGEIRAVNSRTAVREYAKTVSGAVTVVAVPTRSFRARQIEIESRQKISIK